MLDPKKLKSIIEISHDKWFEEWYNSLYLENKILQLANDGYTCLRIILKEGYYGVRDKDDLKRLKDERTIKKLKGKQPNLDISIVYPKKYKNILGFESFTNTEILIDWR